MMAQSSQDSSVHLPPLIPPRQLADACQETAATEDVQPEAVEKDYYLTRVIWALAQVRGDRLLLKGGTCLNKVDLGYYRMSEDIDFVVPWNEPRTLRVDEKLREAGLPPLAEQPSHFDLTPKRRSAIEAGTRSLAAVIRSSEPPFDLDDVASRYDILWGKRP